jgi:hypothetical protein
MPRLRELPARRRNNEGDQVGAEPLVKKGVHLQPAENENQT